MTTTPAVPIGCQSCSKPTKSTVRWAPVLKKGEVVGYTCPACPRSGQSGEPIRREVTRSGEVRFRVTLDIGDDPHGRRRQETRYFTTLADGRAHVRTRGAEIKSLRIAGKSISGRDATTLDELCDRWLESRRGEIREVTRETYGHALKPVRRRLGSRRVQNLTYADVLGLRTWLTKEGSAGAKPLGDHATKTSLSVLKQVLDHGVRAEGIITENVARAVRPPKLEAVEEVGLERWTADQVIAFTQTADDDRLAAAWRLAALGLRREEILGLTWDAIDFDSGTLAVRQTRVAVSRETDAKGWMIGKPKSAASKRVIKPDQVLPGTINALRELKLASVANRGANPQGLVVVDEVGVPVMPKFLSTRFAAVAASAGVPQIRLHSTRHTVAYLMHDYGVPPVRASAFLGHTLAVHLSTYLFAREDDVDLAGLALGERLAQVATA